MTDAYARLKSEARAWRNTFGWIAWWGSVAAANVIIRMRKADR